jgi:hypothetical protein
MYGLAGADERLCLIFLVACLTRSQGPRLSCQATRRKTRPSWWHALLASIPKWSTW